MGQRGKKPKYQNNFQTILNERGMTQKQLAEELHVAPQLISMWIGKKRKIPPVYKDNLERILGCSFNLLQGTKFDNKTVYLSLTCETLEEIAQQKFTKKEKEFLNNVFSKSFLSKGSYNSSADNSIMNITIRTEIPLEIMDEFERNTINSPGLRLTEFLGNLQYKKEDFKRRVSMENNNLNNNESPNEKFTNQDVVKEQKKNTDNKEIILSQNTTAKGNVLVIGGYGDGKSCSYIAPNLLQCDKNFVVSDNNGILVRKYGDFLKSNGYRVILLDSLNSAESIRYNPLHYLSKEREVYSLVDVLMANTAQDGYEQEPFWENAEAKLLTSLIIYVLKTYQKEQRTFSKVIDLLDEAIQDSKSLDNKFNELKAKDPDCSAIKHYNECRTASQTSAALALKNRIYFLSDNIFNISNSDDNFTFNSLDDGKWAIFIDKQDTSNPYELMGTLFYSQLLEYLCKPGRSSKENILFMIDLIAIGKIPNFEMRIATVRSHNISFSGIIKSVQHLKWFYRNMFSSIVGGFSNILLQEICDADTQKWAKDFLLLSDKEISLLQKDKALCYVFIGGKEPLLDKDFNISEHPNILKITNN